MTTMFLLEFLKCRLFISLDNVIALNLNILFFAHVYGHAGQQSGQWLYKRHVETHFASWNHSEPES